MYYLRFKQEAQELTEFRIVIGEGEGGAYVIGEGGEIVSQIVEDDVEYIIEDDEDNKSRN